MTMTMRLASAAIAAVAIPRTIVHAGANTVRF